MTSNEALIGLCTIVLEEWDLQPSDTLLRAPRVAYSPDIDVTTVCPTNEPLSGVYVVLMLHVSPSGTVSDVHVLHSPVACSRLAPYATSLAYELRYRPSREATGTGYVESTTFWVMKAEVY